MAELQNRGKVLRVVAGHDMNERSSRSHSIFTIVVDNSYIDEEGKEHIKTGKLNLVDLAGSERQKKTGAKGEVLDQAIHINQSLSTLGNVVSALVTGKGHVPYRDSKLTKLLSDSLGGNSKTVMIANIGPTNVNYEETVTTLRYADRAKQIKNEPKINEDPKDAMIRQYQEELSRLKEELARASGGINYTEMVGPDGEINIKQFISKEKLEEIEKKFQMDKADMEKQLEVEKLKIVESVNTAEDEKISLLNQLKKKQSEQIVQQKNKEKILEKLKIIEEKFVIGEETEKKAKENELILEKKKLELDEQDKKRIELQKQIKENEDSVMTLSAKYSDQKTEVKEKQKIFETLKTILKGLEREKEDIDKENGKELAEYYEVRRNLEKQMKYNDTILNYFIPDEYLNWIEEELVYDENNNEWSMPGFNLGKIKNFDEEKHLAFGLHDDELRKFSFNLIKTIMYNVRKQIYII